MAFSVTYDSSNGLASGSTASAAHINQNFTDIETELNAFPTDGALGNGVVDTAQLADGALSADATGRAKMADNFITNAKMADNSVSTNDIANSAVSTAKIANDAVTAAKIDSVFGSWASKSNNTQYTAATDGFAIAFDSAAQGLVTIETPVGTTRMQNSGMYGTSRPGCMCPVRKNDTWKATGANTVYWLPLGA